MSFNPAIHKAIAAHTAFRGVEHIARGPVLDETIRTDFSFDLQHSARSQRLVSVLGYRVTVPIVAPFAALLPLFLHFLTLPYGRNLGPTPLVVEEINTSTDVLTITGHTLAAGDAVQADADETFPTLSAGALSRTTTYYVSAPSANTVKLHASSEDALAGTNALNFSAAGLGDFTLYHQFPLTVHRRTGVKRTYRNVVVERLPQLVMRGGALLFEGNLVFRCLPALGTTPGDTDSAAFYSEAASAYVPPTWTGNEVLTKPVTAAWGVAAPWNGFQGENGFVADFAPQLTDFHDGLWPAASLTYTGMTVTAKGKPIGIRVPELTAVLTSDLGKLMGGADLVLTANGLLLTLKQAILDPAAINYAATTGIMPELTWTAGGKGAADLRAPFTISTGA